MAITTNAGIEGAIQRVLTQEIERIISEEAESASQRVQDRVRGKTAEIVARVFKGMSFERFGTDLKIVVSFADIK